MKILIRPYSERISTPKRRHFEASYWLVGVFGVKRTPTPNIFGFGFHFTHFIQIAKISFSIYLSV